MLGQKKQQAAVEEILKTFNGNMSVVLLEVQRLMNAYLINTNVSALTSLQFDVAFNEILAEAGYYNAVNQMVDKDYNKLFALVKEGFEVGGLFMTYTSEDLAVFQALKKLQENAFTVVGSTAGTSLRENLYRYSLSNYTKADMVAQMDIDLQDTNLFKYTKTLANSAISDYQQTIIDVKAEGLEDEAVWLYVGVDDSVTRRFCQCVLDQNAYYDLDTKYKIQNDPQRKYNCRHRLRPVTKDYAESQGFTFKSGSSC